jgi:hypothetical protein
LKETKNEAAVFDCADEACSLVNAKSLLKFLLLRSLSSIDQERLNNTRSERGPMEAGEDTPRVRQCVFFVFSFCYLSRALMTTDSVIKNRILKLK